MPYAASKLAHYASNGAAVHVCKDQFYWPSIHEGIDKEHIRQKVFDDCNIALLNQVEFDAFQATLAQIHEQVKSVSKRGFDDSFRYSHTKYTDSFLTSQGFGTLTASTLVAIDNGTGRFEIAFLYWRDPSIDGAAMHGLCDYVYHTRKRSNKAPRGESFVTDRGDKTMAGKMSAFGSWDAYGAACVGLGKGVMEVRAYNPNGKVDSTLNAHVVAHVDKLTAAETDLTPACAAMRAWFANGLDPKHDHRMSKTSDAFAMTISTNYIADPHDDSGMPGVLEFIQFLNATGPLPPGHKWLFAIAGFLCELPTSIGESVIIALPASGVYHGTLPTSSTTATHPHGNYGSALITKEPICAGLMRQLKRKRGTQTRYRSSNIYYGGELAGRPEYTCDRCWAFEGTLDEVEAHEKHCTNTLRPCGGF